MSNDKKNSVGQAVAVLLVSLRKKREEFAKNLDVANLTQEQLDQIQEYDSHAETDSLKEVVLLNIMQEEYAIKNADTIITKIATAIQWSGVSDTLQERLKKVYSSCIVADKKRPKILTELSITVRELDLIGKMVDSLKSKSSLSIVAIDI